MRGSPSDLGVATASAPQRSTSQVPAVDELYALGLRDLWTAFKAQSLGFKLACLYLVLEYVRPQSIWPVLDILPWTQLTIVIGMLSVLSEIGRRGIVRAPTNFQLILYPLIVAASIVVAYRPMWAISRWEVYLPWVVIYFFIVNAVVGRTRFLLFLIIYLLCSFKMSQFGFRSWAMAGFGSNSWGVTGAPGFFHNSGEVGIQMTVFLPMSLMFCIVLWRRVTPWMRYLLAFLPITAGATILASNSRGAVLGGLAGLVWLGLIGRSKIKAGLGMGLLGFLGWYFMPDILRTRLGEMGTDDTSLTRMTYWKDGLDMVRENPILGVGFENWLPYYADHYHGLEGYYRNVEVCHNIFIQAASELGLLGFISFLLMIGTTFVLNARSRKLAVQVGDVFLERMAHGFDAAMIGFLVSGQFVTVLYYPYFWVGMPMTVMLFTAAREAAGVPFTGRGASIRSGGFVGRSFK